jgi:hypothetical protein
VQSGTSLPSFSPFLILRVQVSAVFNRREAVAARRNSPHPAHPAIKEPLVLVVITF